MKLSCRCKPKHEIKRCYNNTGTPYLIARGGRFVDIVATGYLSTKLSSFFVVWILFKKGRVGGGGGVEERKKGGKREREGGRVVRKRGIFEGRTLL